MKSLPKITQRTSWWCSSDWLKESYHQLPLHQWLRAFLWRISLFWTSGIWHCDSPQVVQSKHCLMHPRQPAWTSPSFVSRRERKKPFYSAGSVFVGLWHKMEEARVPSLLWRLTLETGLEKCHCLHCSSVDSISFSKCLCSSKSGSRGDLRQQALS